MIRMEKEEGRYLVGGFKGFDSVLLFDYLFAFYSIHLIDFNQMNDNLNTFLINLGNSCLAQKHCIHFLNHRPRKNKEY